MQITYEQKPPDDTKLSYAYHAHVKNEHGKRVSYVKIRVINIDAVDKKQSY